MESAESLAVHCKSCEKHVSAKVVGSYSCTPEELGYPLRIALLRCPKCSEPILTAQDHDQEEGWGEPTTLFPAQYKEVGHLVPDSIRRSYEEAVKCFGAKSYPASAIMCRRTLEGLVANQLNKKAMLAKGIQEMKTAGLIDSHLYEWAEMLRVSGNKAAHDVDERVSKQDAQDLIDFCHALLEYIFTYRERFNEFKARAKGR